MKTLLSAATLLVGSLVASSAMAALPPAPSVLTPLDDPALIPASVMIPTGTFDCTLPAAQTQYDNGFHSNYLMIWQAWVADGMDRADVSAFTMQAAGLATTTINSGIAALDPVANAMHNTLGCRLWGSLAGITQATSDVITTAISSCTADGGYIGAYSGHIYCELAAAFGAMPPLPTMPRTANICSSAFEPACETAFDLYTDGYVTTGSIACSDLKAPTDASYAPGYDARRQNDCSY